MSDFFGFNLGGGGTYTSNNKKTNASNTNGTVVGTTVNNGYSNVSGSSGNTTNSSGSSNKEMGSIYNLDSWKERMSEIANNQADDSVGDSGGYTGGSSYYSNAVATQQAQQQAALAAALQAARDARLAMITQYNNALDAQTEAEKQSYENQKTTVRNDYQDLKNQSEVERYKASRNQRETLANRGALGTGTGRQEALNLQTNYGNNLNKISLAEAGEIAKIDQAIKALEAQNMMKKADNMSNGLNDYTSALNSIIQSEYSGYSPENSDYYQNALSVLGNGIGSTLSSTASQNAKAQEEDTYTKLLKLMGA